MSFRLKLMLAMMLAVAGVSGATLYITQQKVQSAYEKVFKEKLEAQITYLPKEQEARLSAVREKCQDLVKKNVRLLAALSEGDTNDLYRVAYDELRKFLRSGERLVPVAPAPDDVAALPADVAAKLAELKKKGGPQTQARIDELRRKAGVKTAPLSPRLREAMFVGFLDAEGKVLPDPAWSGSSNAVQFQQQMVRIGAIVSSLTNQHVGYFDLQLDHRPNLLLELIVTPIVDAVSAQVSGALVLSFPYLDLGEQTISDVSDIDNGIWLDGRLYSHTIREPIRTDLTRLLPGEIKNFPDPREDFFLSVTNIPHRVFYTPLNPHSPLPIAYKIGIYSWASALKAERELRWDILLFSGLALAGALALSSLLAHGLSVPIKELVRGTAEIQRGNFSVKVPVRNDDELGQLAASFNAMADGLALKEKYHDVLNKVADKDVAQQLMSGKVVLGGELRPATILFCDIRGFTALTQNMAPDEVVQLLNEHMTALTRVVNDHHGVVDKFIGDSIMAIFGAPKSYGHDALNAARCARQMLVERQKLNATSRYKIHVGLGLATGPVLAGNMGSAERLNYTVIGERVNLAARLCSVAEGEEIVIGHTTREQLGSLVVVEEMPALRLKGFTDAVQAWRLLEVEPQPVKVVQI